MENEELEEQTGETVPGEETPSEEETSLMPEGPTEETGDAEAPEERVEHPEGGADRRREVETFLHAFPGVEAEDIPPQVWAQAAEGLGLTGAWALYENGLLRQALAALEQNGENRARSLGSLGSRQSVNGGGSIEAYWEEAGG